MNIGFVGLGKLGLPCALAIDAVDEHSVMGYDPDERINDYLNKGEIPYREEGTAELLKKHSISFTNLKEVIESSEIILFQSKPLMIHFMTVLQDFLKRGLILITLIWLRA